MNRFIRWAAVTCAVLVPVVALTNQDSVDGFVASTYTGAAGATMPYRLFIPDAAARVRALPLIVYLAARDVAIWAFHGAKDRWCLLRAHGIWSRH